MGIFVRIQKSAIEAECGRGSSSPPPQQPKERYESKGKAQRALSCRERTTKERSITEQILCLSTEQKAVLLDLKVRWGDAHPEDAGAWSARKLGDDIILRFARSSQFDEGKAWAAMNRFDQRYLSLTAESLKGQLGKRVRSQQVKTTIFFQHIKIQHSHVFVANAQTVFPLAGMKTKDGHECFYIRHSRFDPGQSSIEDAIDPLAYVMNAMCEKEANATNGIALISNFGGWKVEQFSMEYFVLLISVLQGGAVPAIVSSWIIVNAPPFFDRFYAMMKRMMTPSFQRRNHFVPETRLGKHLKGGYRAYLPHEMATGCGITREMVWDFYDARVHAESQRPSCPAVARALSSEGARAQQPQRSVPVQRRRTSATTVSSCASTSDLVSCDSDHSTVTWRRKK
jgi:CRAL/TRIO domain